MVVLLAAATTANAGGKGDLTVVMTGFASDAGVARVIVFDKPEGFPLDGAKALRQTQAAITGGKALAVFKSLPFGAYAVAVLHDDDLSGSPDLNFLGVPGKAFGLSNNTHDLPAFDKSKFTLNAARLTIEITAHYSRFASNPHPVRPQSRPQDK
ncbi:MAG: DUF2141 domain-containing protein [Desulfovibrionaceae bacterium]|nr:DUF2141 domain-containing protein [Desulfovibrionaceae bacterium]MBF0515271.1 DUF2141 domain-containing protein [Desulfovibrionaceae bacterium]